MSTKTPKDIFVQGPISPAFISDSIQKHSTKTEIGAHSIFLGQVRKDKMGEHLISAIEYSSYETMALQQMNQIREEIFAKYELTCLHVYHSLATVNVGEICLFVFTSSKHRKPAIEACEETVERIKKELPIWGKEIFADGNYKWKENI